jgi:hypothetical protein
VVVPQLPFFEYPGVLHRAEARNLAEENAALEAYFQVSGHGSVAIRRNEQTGEHKSRRL